MGHHVVTEFALVTLGGGEVDVVGVRLQLGDLFGRDRQAQLGLGLGERDPKFAPGPKLPLRTPETAHLFGGVTGNERIIVVVGHGDGLATTLRGGNGLYFSDADRRAIGSDDQKR